MKIKKIAEILNSPAPPPKDGDREIQRAAALENARAGEIAFLESPRLKDILSRTSASCVIVPTEFDYPETASGPVLIRTDQPKLAFARIARILHPPDRAAPGIDNSARIAPTAEIGKNVSVGPFCSVGENSVIGPETQLRAGVRIGENVKIGCDCVFYPNVIIEDGCTIGDRVILHPGVVIGADGFGYVRDQDEHRKFPQIGTAVIEDDVEIGANSCVDRGALGETRIGAGTKIDNLVQVAHNVRIGRRVVIASQTGISGSVTIEDDCLIAGQVGFGEHVTVKKGAVIGGKSGVFSGKTVRPGFWSGIPVQPTDKYLRQIAQLRSIGRMRLEIDQLKKKIARLLGDAE